MTQNLSFQRHASWFRLALIVGVLAGIPWDVAAQDPQAAPPPPPPPPATGLSGYMDFHYNNVRDQDAELDFHRFVLLFAHRFSDRIRFVSELELEHAFVEGLEEAGELELEQAYLDFLVSRSFNVRAGMLLMPVGIINERHEPPVFYGVERPLVDTVIIPTTWFETGAGVHGEFGRGWRYRAYLTAPLNAAEFSADEGLRDGRQKGSRANVRSAAATGRVEFVGIRGLTTGASFWAGDSGFAFRAALRRAGAAVRSRRPLLARPLRGARRVRPGGDLERRRAERRRRPHHRGQSEHRPDAARRLPRGQLSRRLGARWGDIGTFVRYEDVDTQARMPAGYVPLEEFDRSVWAVGATYWPDPDIAIKVDYLHQRQPERGRPPASFLQRRTRMVVLMQRLLLVAAAMTLLAAAPWSAGQTAPPAEQTVDILAERFSFTPSEVKVPVGTTLTIRLTSDDTDHGFSIVGENVNVQIPKRSRGAVTVTLHAAEGRPLHLRVFPSVRRRPCVHARGDHRDRTGERRPMTALPPTSWRPRPGQLALGTAALIWAATIVAAGQTRAVQPGDPLAGLTPVEFEEFRLGLDDFLEVETAEEGLGPAFNGASCAVCHSVPAVGGISAVSEVRAALRQPDGSFVALQPDGESLFHLFSIPGHACQPTIPVEANVIIRRVPIPVFGAGLVEAIDDDACWRWPPTRAAAATA